MERRDFLRSTVAGSVITKTMRAAQPIPKRKFKDDAELSVIGFGGIVVCGMEQKEADRWVGESYDRGINYFDVAPAYCEGDAEIKLGSALRPYRKNVFLACKTGERDAKGARRELEQSLERAHTDHFDLYQFHAVSNMDDVEKILAPGGAAEAFLKAREEGKVRHLGFSAHSAEAALSLMDRMELDSVLFPVNYVCYAQGNFGPQILEKAKSKGMARMALKAMAHTRLEDGEQRPSPKCWYKPIASKPVAETALRFTLSQDITAAVPPGDENWYAWALEFARGIEPLTEGEQREFLATANGVAPLFRA